MYRYRYIHFCKLNKSNQSNKTHQAAIRALKSGTQARPKVVKDSVLDDGVAALCSTPTRTS